MGRSIQSPAGGTLPHQTFACYVTFPASNPSCLELQLGCLRPPRNRPETLVYWKTCSFRGTVVKVPEVFHRVPCSLFLTLLTID